MTARDVFERYQAVINAHDFDLIEPLIAEDAVFWFNDGSHDGRAAVRSAFEATWAGFPVERYWLEDVIWVADGVQAAACAYRFRWTAQLGGRIVSGGGRGTSVFAERNGTWQIVHEHLSQHPQADG